MNELAGTLQGAYRFRQAVSAFAIGKSAEHSSQWFAFLGSHVALAQSTLELCGRIFSKIHYVRETILIASDPRRSLVFQWHWRPSAEVLRSENRALGFGLVPAYGLRNFCR